MKKKYLLPVFGALAISVYSFQVNNHLLIKGHKGFVNGIFPAGYTGAPGEGSCTSCHGGIVQSGAIENVFGVYLANNLVTTYVPGQTYELRLSMSTNPSPKGFQATVLNGANQIAGSFVGSTSTQVNILNSRTYASHKITSNTSATNQWIWNWVAPSSDVGAVTFYVMTNKASGSSTSGIYVSTHTLNATADVNNQSSDYNFKVSYMNDDHKVNVKFTSLQSNIMTMNLVDASGKSVFFTDLGTSSVGDINEQIALPELKNGVYFVHFFVGNTGYSGQISIVK